MKLTLRPAALRFLILAVIASLLFTACAPAISAAPTLEPAVTAAQTMPPTAAPTAEPTAIPTPAIDEYGFSEERKAELNQQFQDFLNRQGEFTKEKMSEMMMNPATNLDPSEVGLGVLNSNQKIQGYFFDYYEKDDRLFILMGFDGNDGNRFVTPVEIQIYVYEQCPEAAIFNVLEYKQNDFWGNDNEEFRNCTGEDQIMSLLDSLKSKVIGLDLNRFEYNESDAESYGQVVLDGTRELNSKVELTFGLFQLVSSNNIPIGNPERGDTASIIKIEDVNDVENIDVSKVPILFGISYFIDILNGN